MDAKAVTTCNKTKTTAAIPQCSSNFRLLLLRRKLQRPDSARIPTNTKKNKRRVGVVKACSTNSNSSFDESGHRSMVDEDMLVLRKRMQQLRMEEINYIPPQHWMEWEKKWHPTYGSDVCSSLLCLQRILLNTRPAVAMAVLALISFGVPASLFLLLTETLTNFMGVPMEVLGTLQAIGLLILKQRV